MASVPETLASWRPGISDLSRFGPGMVNGLLLQGVDSRRMQMPRRAVAR
jgi:hypothetical protein